MDVKIDNEDNEEKEVSSQMQEEKELSLRKEKYEGMLYQIYEDQGRSKKRVLRYINEEKDRRRRQINHGAPWINTSERRKRERDASKSSKLADFYLIAITCQRQMEQKSV